MRMLPVFFSVFGECQAPPTGLEYELQRFQSFSLDPCGRKYSSNDDEEDGEKNQRTVDLLTETQNREGNHLNIKKIILFVNPRD